MQILISLEPSPVKVVVAISDTTKVMAEFVGEEPYEVTENLANLIYLGYQAPLVSAKGVPSETTEVPDEQKIPVGNLTLVGEAPAVTLIPVGLEQRTDLWWDEAMGRASIGLAWLLDQA